MTRKGTLALAVAIATGLAAGAAGAQTTSQKSTSKGKAARTKPAKVGEVCETDIAIFCGDLEVKNRDVVRCLAEVVTGLSPDCSAAVASKKKR